VAGDFNSFFNESVDAGTEPVAQEPAPSPSGFDSFFEDRKKQQAQVVQQSLMVASGKSPDAHAKVVQLSKDTGLPTDVVERNYEDVKKSNDQTKLSPTTIVEKNPKLSSWMTDTDNASISHDDVPAMQAVEDKFKNFGRWDRIGSNIISGSARLLSGAAKIPAYMYDVAAFGRRGEKGLLNLDLPERAPESWRDNVVAKFFEEKAESYKTPELSVDITDELAKGTKEGFIKAGDALVNQVAANAPQMVGLLAAAVSGYGPVALTQAGLTSAAEKAAEIQKTSPEVSPETALLNATLTGGLEMATESLGTLGMLKTWSGAIAKKYGKQTAIELMKSFGKTVAYSSVGEGVEEGINSFAADVVDWSTGVTTDFDFKQSLKKSANAAMVGAASGGLMTGPVATMQGVKQATENRTAQMNSEFYVDVNESVQNLKVSERSPERRNDFVKETVAGTDAENVHISAEAFQSYFQSKKEIPAAVAESLGLTKEYNDALETGGDLVIPTHVIVDKLGKTEHYNGLKNDIRFKTEQMSVNEVNESYEAAKVEMTEEDKASRKKEAVPTEEQIALDESKDIGNDIEAQLVESGIPLREAKHQAKLYESFFRTAAKNSGSTPRALFDKYGLKINKVAEAIDVAGEVGYNQAKPNALGFTSKLEQAIDEKMSATQPVASLRAMLKDIKPEEMKWSGLDEFLKGKEKVSKTEVQDFLRANQLEIKEVVKGGEQPQITTEDFNSNYEVADMEVEGLEAVHDFIKPEYLDDSNVEYATIEEYSDGKYELNINGNGRGTFDRMEKAIEAVEEFITGETGIRFSSKVGESSNTKFGKYTEPGGENYREVMFTLPPRQTEQPQDGEILKLTKIADEADAKNKNSIDANLQLKELVKKNKRLSGKFNDLLNKIMFSSDVRRTGERTAAQEQSLKEAIDMVPKTLKTFVERSASYYFEYTKVSPEGFRARERLREISEKRDKVNYQVPRAHAYGDESADVNRFAHIRLNDRVDADGNKVLFVEEMQSDWHHAGRESGYKDSNTLGRLKSLVKEYNELWADKDNRDSEQNKKRREDLANEYNSIAEIDPSDTESKVPKIGMKPTDDQLEGIARFADSGKVPDAPFKNTWHEFTLKRIIRMAAEGGYDKVAWTTGDMQAKRYDLSKQIKSISYVYNKEYNRYGLTGEDNNGSSQDFGVHDADKLADVVGKDLADKIINDTKSGKNENEYSGVELEVGGEGLKFLYDNLYVKAASKLVKKFGGKVGETNLETIEKDGSTLYIEQSGRSDLWYIRDASNDDKIISDSYDTEERASAALKKAQLEESSTIKKKVHSIDITPQLKDAAINQGFALFQENRGRIRFNKDRKFNIDLFKDADRSTFLHESAHFFLEIMGDLAETDGATQKVTDDYATLLEWFGVTDRSQIKTEHHEQFARGFEAYLMEGKAPTSALRKAFHSFKVWLLDVYKKLTALGDVKISDDVREVFDRLLASEQEIADANAEMHYEPMFGRTGPLAMSDAQALKYEAALDEAREFAETQVSVRLMNDYMRTKEQHYKAHKKTVKADITKQVNDMNYYKALSNLQKGTMPDGSALPDGVIAVKLNREELVQNYGADFVKNKLPKPYVYAREGGSNADAVALMYGLDSGDTLVQMLSNMPSRVDMIDQMTDEHMSKAYPDLIEDQQGLNAEAINAVHNKAHEQKLRMELEHLATNNMPVLKDVIRRVTRRVPVSAVVKEQAKKIIGGTKVSEIKPHRYRQLEIKWAKKAGELLAKGDIDGAFDAKRKEYLNYELYRAADAAVIDIEKSSKKMRQLLKKSDADLAKTRDVDYVNAAKSLLAAYGVGRTDKSPAEYLSSLQKYDPEGYNAIMSLINDSLAQKDNFANINYDVFTDLKETVEAIWDLSKSSREIEIDGLKMDSDKVKEELIAQSSTLLTSKEKKEYNSTADKHDKFKTKLLGAVSAATRIETWADVMDQKHGGPYRRYIWQPVSEAVVNYRDKSLVLMKKYEALLRGYEKNLTREKIKSNELKFQFQNKTELIMALLHTGNESNYKKLLVGRGWGFENSDGTVDDTAWKAFVNRMHREGVLNKVDYDFVQSIWDLMESVKPDTQKAHKQMFGFYFNEITANEFTTPYGTYRGGYVPAKVDTHENEDADIRKEREQFEQNNTSFAFPTTGKGATMSRVEGYAAPLSLDMNMLQTHLDWAMRFTYIEPTIKQVARIVMAKDFRSALREIDETIAKDGLVPWLQRTATQQVVQPASGGIGRVTDAVAGVLRTNAAIQIMAGNLTNTIQQITGLSVAMVKIKPSMIGKALVRYIAGPSELAEAATSKSKWMQQSLDSSIFDVSKSIQEVLLNPSTLDNMKSFTKKHTYFLQSMMQNVVNTVVWSAAYDQAVAQKMIEKEAIRFADSVVRTTQGSNKPEDISAFETGTKTELLFKQFVGFFNMLANLNVGEMKKIPKEIGLKDKLGRGLYIYTMGLMSTAVISQLVVVAMSGKGFDDDDDGEYVDDFLDLFFGSQLKTMFAMIPYGGQVATATYNKMFTEQQYDDRVSMSPAISVLEGTTGLAVEVYKKVAKDADNEKKLTKDALTLIGVMTGLPTGPVGKPVGYLMDVSSGKASPTGPIDFTRGLVTGKPGRP
jgi:hypothetical protein